TLAPDTLPSVGVGVNYSQTITAIGGSTPYDFVLTAGSLPSGFTLSSSGVISGKTTLAGNYNFTVRALDDLGCAGIKNYTITITADTVAPTITAPPDVSVMTGAGATTCGAFISNSTLGTATASDNLPGVIV